MIALFRTILPLFALGYVLIFYAPSYAKEPNLAIDQKNLKSVNRQHNPNAINNHKIIIEKGIQLSGETRNQQFKLTNSKNQRNYLIQVFEPKVSPPKDGFSVIYMLDGNASFPYASVIAQAVEFSFKRHHQAPPIIVAIGYDIDSTIDVEARTFDYTPPIEGELIAPVHRSNSPYPIGGAEDFYQFIQYQLKPLIAQHYTINTLDQSLFGHSYGGLFTLYTLLKHPESFQHYYAASPSIWWHDEYLLKQAADFKNQYTTDKTLKPITLTLSAGEGEIKKLNKRHTSQKLSDITRFAQALSEINNVKTDHYIISHASHFEAMFPAINRAISDAQQRISSTRDTSN